MALKTLGFVSVVHLNGHYQKHGSDFGCADENQYEAMADEFLGGPKQSSVLECVRGRGDLCRFDMLSEAYGILSAKGEIRNVLQADSVLIGPDNQSGSNRICVTLPPQCNQSIVFQGGVCAMVIGYTCPVCGFRMKYPAADYNICPSCGTEFGNNDVNASIEDLRASWLDSGPRWWSKFEAQPANWEPIWQVASQVYGNAPASSNHLTIPFGIGGPSSPSLQKRKKKLRHSGGTPIATVSCGSELGH